MKIETRIFLDRLKVTTGHMDRSAKAFVDVLHFVKWIGEEIDGLFSAAIQNLRTTIVTSMFNNVPFRAFQGNNIADRNLHERANDVSWWALTPMFRELLTRHRDQGPTDRERQSLTRNLQYINDLYTPYLADTQGRVVATSVPPDSLEERLAELGMPSGHEFVGMTLEPQSGA